MGKILTKRRKIARKEPIREEQDDYAFPSLSPPASDNEQEHRIENDKGKAEGHSLMRTEKSWPTQTARTPRTPSKPRHLDFLPATPTSSGLASPLTTPPTTPSVYSLAKGLFQRGSKCTAVFGREKERQTIYDFINPLIGKSRAHGALYISGVPGTGKSALLNETLTQLTKTRPKVKQANINCMIVDKPALIYHIIYEALTDSSELEKKKRTSSGFVNDYLELTETEKIVQKLDDLFLKHPRTSHIVVLDELDHVMTKDQEVLFKIFQWAFMENSNLILIGIANALDLTDRFLPRLRANSLSPQVLPLTPYTATEVEHIIVQRLRTLTGVAEGPIPLLEPTAIKFCARKTAANTGDLRKAMDICRRAIETVEEEVRRSLAMEAYQEDSSKYSNNSNKNEDHELIWKRSLTEGVASGNLASISEFTLENAPKATVAHVAKICNVAFGGSTVSRIKDLNLHQKAVLCVLVQCERTVSRNVAESLSPNAGATSTMTVSKLYDNYTKVSEREMVLGKLNLNEFFDVVSALEAAGVISVSGICGRKGLGSGVRSRSSRGGNGAAIAKSSLGYRDDYGLRKIVSAVHIMDLTTAISEIPLLRQFIV